MSGEPLQTSTNERAHYHCLTFVACCLGNLEGRRAASWAQMAEKISVSLQSHVIWSFKVFGGVVSKLVDFVGQSSFLLRGI